VLTGLVLVMIGVLAASIANVMQLMPAIRSRPVAAMLGWAMLYGAALDALFAWAFVGPPAFEPRLGYWLGLLYLGVVASALTFWLYFEIIRKVGPARAAYSSVLIPIVAMAISTIAEGYVWSPLAIAGGLFTIAGLVVALGAPRSGPAPLVE
jgi:drug/metabolite transporter (DMT)-like permease